MEAITHSKEEAQEVSVTKLNYENKFNERYKVDIEEIKNMTENAKHEADKRNN